MRSRHQAINFSSRAKKQINKELFETPPNKAEQWEYLSSFFDRIFPEKGEKNVFLSIQPSKFPLEKKTYKGKIKISSNAVLPKFPQEVFQKEENNDESITVAFDDMKKTINKEKVDKEKNDVYLEELVGFDIKECYEKKDILENYQTNEYNSKLNQFFNKMKTELENSIHSGEVIKSNCDIIKSIEFSRDGNKVNLNV